MWRHSRRTATATAAVLVLTFSATAAACFGSDEPAAAERTSDPQVQTTMTRFCEAVLEPLDLGTVEPAELGLDVEALNAERRRSQKTIVYLIPDATPAQIDAMRDTIEERPGVQSERFVSQQDAMVEFTRNFPDVDDVTERDLPASFEISATGTGETSGSALDAFVDELRLLPVVFEVVHVVGGDVANKAREVPQLSVYELLTIPWQLNRLIVFMDPASSAAQTADVRAILDTTPYRYEWVDQHAAYLEFRQMFPDLLEMSANEIPPSFRIETPTRLDSENLAARFESTEGVFQTQLSDASSDLMMSRLTRILAARPAAADAISEARAAAPDALRPAIDQLREPPRPVSDPEHERRSGEAAITLRLGTEEACSAECCVVDLDPPLSSLLRELTQPS